ncbi:MAG: hypothetical protein ABEH64_14160, partial [Salinirussus sp.]
DFEQVRENLEPVADLVARLDERRAARERYRSARSAVAARRRTVSDRIDKLERIKRLGAVDLDAPTDRLRNPIDSYNEQIADAFEAFRREAPAREVLDLVDKAQRFPIVSFRNPPDDLRQFVDSADAGTEPIPTLLEYAEYSRSKLEHYVADPSALKTAVRPHTTYLRRLDADPLTVEWPPPPAARLSYQCREAERVVTRFAPAVVEQLRQVRRLPKTTDYERIREAAVARDELDEEQRERLRSGAIEEELDQLRAELATLEEALEEYPEY